MREVRTAESLEMGHPILRTGDEPLLPTVDASRGRAGGLHALDWRQVLGGAAILLGFVALAIGWWGISGTTKTYQQLTYLLSGGLVGASLIAVGGIIVIAYQHHADRLALLELERRIACEFDLLYSKLGLDDMVIPERAEERGSGIER
jgi:hypothetical protein